MGIFSGLFSSSSTGAVSSGQLNISDGTMSVNHSGTGQYTVSHAGNATSGVSITFNGSSVPAGLTKEEELELQQLEMDYGRWHKFKQLDEFKKLPSHIRQNVVDESIVRDTMNNINSVDPSGFEDFQRKMHLEAKKSAHFGWGYGGYQGHHNIHMGGNNFKYQPLLNLFSTDELAEAHGSATIEEELSDENS